MKGSNGCTGRTERAPSALAAPAKPSVLVVDDEPQVLVALEDILSDQFIVHATQFPEQALELARQRHDIAVVISDQRMPIMTGDELLGNLAHESNAERILLTGYADLTAVVKAINDGRIFAYITKPWDPEQLRREVWKATEHFRLHRELAHERQLLRDLMENVPDGIYFKDLDLCFTRVNEPLAAMLGASEAARLVGKKLCEVRLPGLDAEEIEARERRIVSDGVDVVDAIREQRGEEHIRWFSETKVPVRGANGDILGLVGISRDVTERVKADQARSRQERRIARLTRIHAMLSGINGAMVRTRGAHSLLHEACRIAVREGQLSLSMVAAYDSRSSSFSVVASVGTQQSLEDCTEVLLHVAMLQSRIVINDVAYQPNPEMGRNLTKYGHRAIAAFPLFESDRLQYVLLLCSPQVGFFDKDEVRLLSDLADNLSFALNHIAATRRLDFLAYYDELTKLPNQRLFMDRLTQQLGTCQRAGKVLAMVMLDIDRFRQVNEIVGRSGGDALLQQVADRLCDGMQERDSIARVDGNRFAMFVPLVENEAEVAGLVKRLMLDVMGDHFAVGETRLAISARAGISLFPSDAEDPEALIANAEAALRKSKHQAQRYMFYAPSMNARVREKVTLETKLRQALDQEEFVLHYQPKVELREGRLVGLEALIRWQSPDQGLVPPGVFIPVLEETGLISDVGRWVLMSAAAQYTQWKLAGKDPPRIAVNVSALQLSQGDFLESLGEVIQRYELAAHGLDLEITESVFVGNSQDSIHKLEQARGYGCEVAIDDFGTGYSSLGYLSRLPIDTLKIDRSFVSQMTRDPQNTALVTTVISLAHSLDCQVVAEGVEREGEARLLRLLGCDQIQGYLVAKPLPASQVVTQFDQRHRFKWTAPAA